MKKGQPRKDKTQNKDKEHKTEDKKYERHKPSTRNTRRVTCRQLI